VEQELSISMTAFRLGVSLILGGVIGIEREIHGKSAGLRTHMLVALGSALFTILSFAVPDLLHSSTSDPTRIAAQVLTGVGFLGAGTILQSRGSVHGLTTAASIWLVAAIGMAAGSGFYRGAVLATVFGHVVLIAFSRLEQNMLRNKTERHVITAHIQPEDREWFENLMLGLRKSGPTSWDAKPDDSRLLVRIEGRLQRKEMDKVLAGLRQRGTLERTQVKGG
jgi:uncharacterized membrane protein YhiD involved in acid resistance